MVIKIYLKIKTWCDCILWTYPTVIASTEKIQRNSKN